MLTSVDLNAAMLYSLCTEKWTADMAQPTESWAQKICRLEKQLDGEAATASALGLTPRRLNDFKREAKVEGKVQEPSPPVQNLIRLLLREDTQGSQRLTLVLVQDDFEKKANLKNPITTLQQMFKKGSDPVHNTEFHYIAAEPDDKSMEWLKEALMRDRVQPHFDPCPPDINNERARSTHFTAVAMAIVAKASQLDIARVFLAANPDLWPLAVEIKRMLNVDVTLVRIRDSQYESIYNYLESSELGDKGLKIDTADIDIADGRKLGSIKRLVRQGNENWYGFIHPDKDEPSSQDIFFSWNHMLKNDTKEFEFKITSLNEGDTVSYTTGMNHMGLCATDVALVKKNENSATTIIAGTNLSTEYDDKIDMVDQVTRAIDILANATGYALMSAVGQRIKTLNPKFEDELKALGLTKLGEFVNHCSRTFETTGSGGTLRVRKKTT
ncbi:hypothetical protein AGMMS50225_06610 [Betaproteobacteria bacterium]|nr:hypothetical protein AGMMS50225_06610 [Betaproteobacteria bacterium]